MAILQIIDSEMAWTGSWAKTPNTRLLLDMQNYTGEFIQGREVIDKSDRGNRPYLIPRFPEGRSSALFLPDGFNGLKLVLKGTAGEDSYLRIPYKEGLWPTGGTFFYGAWVFVQSGYLPMHIFYNRIDSPGDYKMFPSLHLAEHNGVMDAALVTYKENSWTEESTVWANTSIPMHTWVWVGVLGRWLDNSDLANVTLYVASAKDRKYVYNSTNVRIRRDCNNPVKIGGSWKNDSNELWVDDAVIEAGFDFIPRTFEPPATDLPFGGDLGLWATTCIFPLRELNTGITFTPSGRVLVKPTEYGNVTAYSWDLPGDVPAGQRAYISYSGKSVLVYFRTSTDRINWSEWYPHGAAAEKLPAPWIQFKILLQQTDSYLENIILHTNPPLPIDYKLPHERPIPEYKLTPILIKPNSGGELLRDSLLSCKTVDTTNHESSLTFSLTVDDPKAKSIDKEMPLEFMGRHYKVRKISCKKSRSEGIIEVYAERLWYDLIYSAYVDSPYYQAHRIKFGTESLNTTAYNALLYALDSTAWKPGKVDDFKVLSWKFEGLTSLEMLKAIAKSYNLNLVLDDVTQYVHLLDTVGRDRGVFFKYGKDIKEVHRTLDSTSLINRLYGRNQDGVTIAEANGGDAFITARSDIPTTRSQVYTFASGYSPKAMLNALEGFLAARSIPKVSYSYFFAGLANRIDEIDRFEVNDLVSVYDEDLKLEVAARVANIEMDWINIMSSRVTLSSNRSTLAESYS